MEDMAKDITNKYKNDSSPDFKIFITELIQPVMYLLKRQIDLTEFFESLKTELTDLVEMSCVSQRLLIDTIMMNSDRFLCRRLMKLLSKRNPVPMIQPPIDLTRKPISFDTKHYSCMGLSTTHSAVVWYRPM